MPSPADRLPTTPLRWRVRHWLVSICLLTTWAGRALADAPPPPTDVAAHEVPAQGAPLGLPAPPDSFVTLEKSAVRWTYPRGAEDDVRELMAAHPALWKRITSELGSEVPADMTVRVARSPEEMRRLAPQGAPPPEYAVGVAYPGLGLVMLSLVAPDSWLPPDLLAVYTHELSHIALHRATGGRPVPRWFTEGLAIYQAKEQKLARVRTLWEATVSGTLLPLRNLDRHFPTRPHEVNVAYAQSGDLVQHLLSAPDDRGRFRRVIRDLREGVPFEAAFEEAYYVPPEMLEREWRAGLEARFTSLPLVLSGGALWGLLGVLLVWAFVSKRRRDKRTLAQWAEQEAAAEANRPAQVVVLAGDATQAGAAEESAWAASALEDSRRPHHTPASGVPTIEHDGQYHTLH